MIERMDNVNNEDDLKQFFIDKNLISSDGKILPITFKKINLFLSNSNVVFHSFYSSYPEAAIKYFPYVVCACFYRDKKVLRAFLKHTISYINIDKLQYSLQDLEHVKKLEVQNTEISQVLSKILHKRITPQKIDDVHDNAKQKQSLVSFDPIISIFKSQFSESYTQELLIQIVFLKVFEPYLEKYLPKEYKAVLLETSNNLQTYHFLNVNSSILNSNFHLLFEEDTTITAVANGKFAHHLELEKNPDSLFDLHHKDYLYSTLFSKNIVTGKFLRLDNFISSYNKMIINDWISINPHLPNNKKQIFPESFLSSNKYNNHIQSYFSHHKNIDILETNPKQERKITGVLLKMIMVNHVHLDFIIQNNNLTPASLNKIVSKVTDKIESDTVFYERDLIDYSQYIPRNLLRRECLEEFFFNLNNILDKYPHLKENLSINTKFFKSDEKFEFKNIDLHLFRTPSYKKLLADNPHAFHPRAKIAIEQPIDDLTLSLIYMNSFVNANLDVFTQKFVEQEVSRYIPPPSSILRNIYFDLLKKQQNHETINTVIDFYISLSKENMHRPRDTHTLTEELNFHLSHFNESFLEEKTYQSFSFMKNIFKKVLLPKIALPSTQLMDLLSFLNTDIYLKANFSPSFNNNNQKPPLDYINDLLYSEFDPFDQDTNTQNILNHLIQERFLLRKLSTIDKNFSSKTPTTKKI